MAKTRQQKEQEFQNLVDSFAQAKSAVFINFDGLNVNSIEEFRSKCREEGLTYVVAKKSLLKLAIEKAGVTDLDTAAFERGVGTVFSSEDEVAPAQAVDTFAKDHEAMSILAGVMMENPAGEQALDIASVKALAKLPSKEQLLGQVVGTLNAPISGFVNVLAGNLRGLVNVLNAVKDQKSA